METVAPTAPVVEQIDQLQYEFKEGTCFEATWEGETMRAPDLASDPRWPNWGPHAVAERLVATRQLPSAGDGVSSRAARA